MKPYVLGLVGALCSALALTGAVYVAQASFAVATSAPPAAATLAPLASARSTPAPDDQVAVSPGGPCTIDDGIWKPWSSPITPGQEFGDRMPQLAPRAPVVPIPNACLPEQAAWPDAPAEPLRVSQQAAAP